MPTDVMPENWTLLIGDAAGGGQTHKPVESSLRLVWPAGEDVPRNRGNPEWLGNDPLLSDGADDEMQAPEGETLEQRAERIEEENRALRKEIKHLRELLRQIASLITTHLGG